MKPDPKNKMSLGDLERGLSVIFARVIRDYFERKETKTKMTDETEAMFS